MFFNTLLSIAMAGPEGAQVVNGQVSFQQSGFNTTITASDKAIINYSSFDIARPEIVEFIQPNSNASVLNRILSANPTNINGTLLANGRVFFVNPAGVYIGAGARVNVNQLVASSLNITNSDFINGRYNFAGGDGSVINSGDISAEKVYLIGRQVANSGSIHCPAGYVVMAAGDRVFLSEPGSDVMVEIDPQTSSDPAALADSGPGVLNQDEVDAAGSRIVLAAGDIHTQAISNVGSLAASIEIGGAGQISNTGTIEARSDNATGGTIIAKAAEITNSGTVDVTGSEGGEVTMEATGRLGQFGIINADGTTGNGGNVELRADDVVALSSDSLTTANAGTHGDGGDVIAFSPDTVLFREGAQIEAKGGSESGDGGFVEVSGKEHVEVFGLADVSANNGDGGTFFIDPHNVTIQDGAGTLDSGGNPFAAGSDGDTVSDDAIEGVINTGGAAVVQTSDGGFEDGDIIQDADATIDFTGAGGDASLTLNAADDVELNGGIAVTGATAALTVTINANGAYDTASGRGDVDINADIATNGGSFTSSGVDFDNASGEITTDGGNVNLDGHTGFINIGASIVADTGDISTIGGSSVLVRAQASNITAGNVDIETTGSFTCEPGSRITAGGDGTDLNVNAGYIALNEYGVGNETLTNTGNGTITLTASGDTFLADHSINIDEGTLNIKSANIKTSPLPMMSLSQKVENNPNIMVAAGIGSEIKANGVVSLTAGAIGYSGNYLDLDGAAALEITATGAGGIWIRENASTIKSTAITVDKPMDAIISIDYAENGGNNDAIQIWHQGHQGGHFIEMADLDNDSDSSFSYSVGSGDIILGAGEGSVEDPPIKMGENGDVTLSTPDDIVFPDWSEEWPLIITAGGSVSLTADAIYGYIYNGSLLTAPLGIQGATALTLTDTGPGPIELAEVGGSTIGSTSITVGDIGYGTIDIAYDDERSWVDIDNDHFINSVVLTSSFSYTATNGDISIGSIEVNSESSGEVDIIAGGAIRDAINDSDKPELDVDVAGATINLTAQAGGIGTEALVVAEYGFIAENRVLEITASRELNADTSADSGHILISILSDLPVGLVDAGSGEVTLNATDAIRDAEDDSAQPLVDVVGATVNLNALAGGIGTDVLVADDGVSPENRVLEVAASRELNVDTSANGGDILISSLSDLPLGLVDAGTGDVTLVSVGAIRDAVDDLDEPIVDAVGVTINLTARQGGIGTEVLVADNGVSPENRVLEVAASRELNVDTSADSGHILISSIDDLLVGLVDAGMGSVNFDSTDAINDASDDINVDIIADMLTLSADDEIGGNPTPGKTTDTLGAIETTVASLDASSTTAGDIVITETDDIILTDVDTVDGDITIVADGTVTATDVQTTDGAVNLTAGGSLTATLVAAADASDDEEHDVTLSTTGAGNVTLTSVTADDDIMVSTAAATGDILISSITAADDISLTATQGAIREAVDYTEDTNIRAVSVQLSAATAITGNSPIETSARSITARTDEGDIDIDNDNTLPITASLEVSTGAGNIKFRQTGGGALTAQEATTQDGTIHIEVDSAELTAGNITAGGKGNIIVSADGDVKVGNVTALDNQITINSAGAIKESVNDRDVDLTAASLALTAKDGIGIHRSGESLDIKIPVPIETDAASIVAQTGDNAESSSHIFINVQNTEYTSLEAFTVGTGSCIAFRQADGGELTLGALHTSDGSITVGADGDVKVGSITAFDNQITIDSAGAIDDAAVDVVTDFTAKTLTLTAYDGIGATAEIETDVSSLSAHSIASDIMIVEKDTTSLDRIILIDVDTIDGRINITVEEAVGATGDTVLTAVDADGDDDEDEVVITAAAGDITIGEVSADNVSLEATQGSINDASDDTITDITGDILMLTARDEIGGSPTAGTITDTRGAIEVASTGLDVSVNTAGNIVLTESDGTELTDVDTAGGSIDIVSTTGDLTVGDIDATTTVTLEAFAGSIEESGADAGADLTASTLDLDAATGIGANGAIEASATTISADTTNGNKDIDNSNASATTVSSVTTGTGNIDFSQAGGGALKVTTATAVGNIAIDAEAGIQIGGSITAGSGYDITASGGDVIFDASGKVTGEATSAIEATAGSIANTGSDEATTIETRGAGSNLTLTAANASTQSTKPMTIVSGGDLTLNAPLDNTSSATSLSAADNLAINKGIQGTTSISAHGGTDGGGNITFGAAGVTLDAPIVTLRAGDGLGGSGTAAQVDITTNNPTVVANSALTVRQDGAIADTPNVGNNGTIDLMLQSDDRSIYTTDADSWQSITATSQSGIKLKGSRDITTNALTSTNGDIAIESTTGAVIMNDTVITNEGGGVTITAQDDVTAQAITTEAQAVTTNSDIEIHSLGGDLRINDNLTANGGGVSLIADNGKITTEDATAKTGIQLEGPGNITTKALTTTTGNISVHSTGSDLFLGGAINEYGGHERGSSDKPLGGGVELIADSGKITSGGDTLNIAITGYSDEEKGVVLPNGSGKAAIVIRSKDDLNLGPNAELTANGSYGSYKTGVDDRPGVGFKSRGEGSGDPIDVAIYVGTCDFEKRQKSEERWIWGGGNVTIESEVFIGPGGTMVIDAENTVNAFGDAFKDSATWENPSNRLEVVSRRTQTLDQAAKYRTLPHAEEVHQGKTPPWFSGSRYVLLSGSRYVLRGKRVAEVLGRIEPAPVDFDREDSDQEDRRSRPERFEEEALVIKPPFDLRDRDGIRIRKLKQGMALQAGYQLTTPEDIRSFIEFPNGLQIIVEPNTCITVKRWGIYVSYGKIWFWSMFESPIGRVEIETADGTISLTGTDGHVDVSSDGTILWMLEGEGKAILDGKDLGSITENEAAVIERDLNKNKRVLLDRETDWFRQHISDRKGIYIKTAGPFPTASIGTFTPWIRLFWAFIKR